MADQAAQYYREPDGYPPAGQGYPPAGQGYPPAAHGGQPAPAGKSFLSKMTDTVQGYPGTALAIIVALVLVVLYLYAQRKGWFGLGSDAPPPRAGGAGSRAGAKAPRAAADPETEELIDSINSASR